jgi:chromosome segregation ATPase
MLDAYGDLLKQMEEKREAEAQPEQKVAEKAVKEVVAVADSLTADSIFRDINGLKAEVGKMLTTLSDRLEQEVGRYDAVKRAIAEKEQELAEIYEIQKAASSLAALIEAQNLKKEEFEADMAARKEALTREIDEMRSEWQKEKAQRAAEQKEQDAVEARKRSREKEEYDYALQRERQAARDAFEKEKEDFEEEKARLEREIALRREQTDREFAKREQSIARQEQELADLRARVAAFPRELETTVAGEVKAAVEKVQTEGKFRLDLVQKEFEGGRNVLQGRIASLESVLKDQSAQLAKLNEQVEKSYSQVQAIAVKAVEGSAAKAASAIQPQQRQGE